MIPPNDEPTMDADATSIPNTTNAAVGAAMDAEIAAARPSPDGGQPLVQTEAAPAPALLRADRVPPAPPRPAPGTPRAYRFPAVERRTLPNGMRLVVAPVHKLPVVSVSAVIDAGATLEPEGHEGVASLMARALTEGAADRHGTARDGVALTEALERLGATVDAGADYDAVVANLTVLRPRAEEALALFADVLVRPTFPEREVERLRQERLAELLHLQTEPRGLAEHAFARAVFSAASRYARPEAGDRASVERLDVDAVRAFHAARFRPERTLVVVAGDVTADDAERLVGAAFAEWTRDGAVEAARPIAADVDRATLGRPAADTRRTVLVAKPDAQQSELRVGHVGVPRHHPDYFPLVVMNAILGGLFNSRVNLNLRERHGYTYGAHSGFDWRVAAGPFAVSSAVQSESTDKALVEVLAEVARIRDEPVSADELSLATSYLDGVFPIRYETTAAIAGALANAEIFGLPTDYFDTYRARVRAVTAEDVQRVAQAHLRPEELQVVVVGDPATVRAPLAALHHGPLSVVDADGRPVT